jgi:signal transduction histidine kinase
VLLAASLVAFGVVEVLGLAVGDDVVQGPTWLNLLAVTAFGLPVAWRRRAPLLGVIVVHVALGLRALHDQPLELYAPVFASLITAYSLGVYGQLRAVPPALAVSAAGLVVAQERGTGGPATPDAVAMLVLLGALWVVGLVIGRRSSESAAALQRAEELDRRRAEEAAAAVAAERRRIAHELHDAVSHSLAMITMQAGGAQDVVATDPDRAVESLRTIERAARQGLTEMRQLLGLLDEPASREPSPDLDRVPALIEGALAAGVDARLLTTGTPRPVSAALGATGYRIVQEALTNAARHGGRCSAAVTLGWTPSVLRIEVVNDLRAGTAAPGSGRGLAGMRERAVVVGGRLEAGLRADGRFAVTAELPLEEMAWR